MTAPTTTSLADFLLAQLAADEAAALAATPGPWSAADEHGLLGPDTSPAWCVSNMCPGYRAMSPTDGYIGDVAYTSLDGRDGNDATNARHIARHDPARVLVDVKAKRAIVALGPTECSGYADQYEFNSHHYPDPAWSHCDGCASAESVDAVWTAALRALAQPYRDQPGWQDEWA